MEVGKLRRYTGLNVVAVWLTLFVVSKTYADTVFKMDGTVVFGRVVHESETEVRISKEWNSNEDDWLTIPRNEIQLVLSYLDENRLEALVPQGMQAYLDYAEELSRFDQDPLAIDLTQRLLLLALDRGTPSVQRRAVSMLSSMTLTEVQQEILSRYRRWIGMDIGTAMNGQWEDEPSLDLQQVGFYLTWLASVRRGAAESKTEAELQTFQQMHGRWKSVVSWEEIRNAVQTQQSSLFLELKLLRLEVKIADDLHSTRLAQKRTLRWEDARFDRMGTMGLTEDLERAFQMDLARPLYRQGKWVSR